MKKIIVVLFICLIICSCGKQIDEENQYNTFPHYSKKEINENDDSIRYIFKNDKNQNMYVVANITKEDSERNLYGLFYQINEDEYILLKEFDGNNSIFYFYQDFKNSLNKFYAIDDENYLELELDKENIKTKELNFDMSKISQDTSIYGIKDVTPEFIYFLADCSYSYRTIIIKCSFDNLICELEK